MANYEANGARDQGSRKQRRIDVPRFKELVKGQALDIIGKRMKIVGRSTGREVRIINTHRGEKTASASWNAEKGLFCDKGDPSYNGNIITLVAKCHGVSFIEAVRIIAEETGVDVPHFDGSTVKPGEIRKKPKSNGSRQQHPSTEDTIRQADPQPDSGAKNGDDDRDAETPEKKIERARRAWMKAGNVLDTFGEEYLNARMITLDAEEPWLRFDESHALHVRMETEDHAPEYPLVGYFPTLIGAATIAGRGDVQAVAKIWFKTNEGGSVDPKPTIIDPRTGEPFKKNKLLRGVMGEAGIFLGQHLAGDAIVITEGVEDALCAVKAGFAAVAKMGAQTPERLTLPGHIKRVILAGDNDETGGAGVRKAAPVYHERGYAVSIVKLAEGVKDLNEMLVHGGIDALRDAVTAAEPWEPAPEQPEREPADEGATSSGQEADAKIEFADDMQLPTNTNYLIKHLLARGDLGAIYGPPGAGKSFIALHLAGCIALGQPFAGHRTRATPVLYVGLEGEAGMRRRMIGLKKMGPFGKMLARMRLPGLLCQDEAGTEGEQLLIHAITNLHESSGQEVGLVIIDTVWRAMAGDDENSAKDMGKFIARLGRIQVQTGVAVLLVHHSGKDVDRGMRGSSSLLGAVDLVLKVADKEVLTVEKNKDGSDDAVITFRLRVVDLGRDDEGDPINTCVVEIENASGASSKQRRTRPRGETAAGKALQQLEELVIAQRYETVVGQSSIPDHAKVVKLEDWRQACRHKGLAPGSDTEKRDETEKRTFRRVMKELEATDWIGITDDKVWIIQENRWQGGSSERTKTTADNQAENEPAAA